ncbi:MAG: NUDIX hydrolase [Meiothermus sp.]|uniref:NUDIX hydrolase n=1 Tax=Meiothermus sp. TaxID=1955249 RepID=UPI0026012E4E|nr:NUDIX hydrolase [Meiothermus sp.]MCS7069623.1 NUDIX hydrolase [Meiothermus sp.]MCX7600966.1 NUDIX hydrolase [Meiothermus sp.]MDW8426633.1 NUDIX hydrolase [Meiothermus sp.]
MPERQYLYKGRILNLALQGSYEIVEHAHAVAILVEREGQILFVRQYRPAIGSETLEIPAGLIDPGETPEQAARRELAEEAQLTGELEYLTSFYVSPGFCDEKLYVFRATNLRAAFAQPDDDEDITIEWRNPRQVLREARDGQVQISASAMAGILFYLSERGLESPVVDA